MRVAALLPAATEIVIALGAGDQLVAVTHACTLPARLLSVPRVTRSRVVTGATASVDSGVTGLSAAGASLFDLDDALLGVSRPDVILTQAVCDVCAVREADARAAAARLHPVPRVITLGARTVGGVLDDIRSVGTALGIVGEAEELVAGLLSRIRAVHRKLKEAGPPRPRVLVLEWIDPPFGAGHWVPDIVRRAGGIEVIGTTGEQSRRISKDEYRDTHPDVLIVAPCGYDLDQGVREVKGFLREGMSMWVIDANRLTSSPGPGVVRGIEVLARVLHPQLFGTPSATDALRIA